jgi:hypothetical protein
MEKMLHGTSPLVLDGRISNYVVAFFTFFLNLSG